MTTVYDTQQPMPAELANARPPTRQDAIERIRNRGQLGSRTIEEFDDSLRGKQCGRNAYRAEMCQTYRAEFDRKREAAIDDALATLTSSEHAWHWPLSLVGNGLFAYTQKIAS